MSEQRDALRNLLRQYWREPHVEETTAAFAARRQALDAAKIGADERLARGTALIMEQYAIKLAGSREYIREHGGEEMLALYEEGNSKSWMHA